MDTYKSEFSGSEIDQKLENIENSKTEYNKSFVITKEYSGDEDIFYIPNLLYEENGIIYLVLSVTETDTSYIICILQNDGEFAEITFNKPQNNG